MTSLFGDVFGWIAARHCGSPFCAPTAIDIIAISVEGGDESGRRRVALLTLGWHGRRLLLGVP